MPDTQQIPEDEQEFRTLESMRVVRKGRGQYACHSQSQPEVAYMVDLYENPSPAPYAPLGSCTCDDFTMRRKPRWKGVGLPFPVYRCKHIARVRNFVLDQIVIHYIRPEQQQ